MPHHDSWDDPDSLGRLHKRMVKASSTHLKKALESGDRDSVEAWSRTMTRHSRELLLIMGFKRLVLLDIYGLGRRPAYETEARAWLPPPDPPANDREHDFGHYVAGNATNSGKCLDELRYASGYSNPDS